MKLKKVLILILIPTLFVFLSFFGCKNEEVPKELSIYVWEGYLPEQVAQMFEEETEIKLNINLISDNSVIFNLLKGGGSADIIMPTQNQVNRYYDEDLAQPLDLDQIENYNNLSDTFKNQEWNMWDGSKMGTGDTFVVPYIFGTSGIVVNTEKYTGPLEGLGWEILFDPELKSRVSSKNSAESLMICLDLAGIPREELGVDTLGTLEKIRDRAVMLKNNVLKFYNTGAELLDLLSNEEVWVSHIWDGGGRKMAATDPKFKYVLPVTGGFGWTDTFMIPANAKNIAGAHMFIDFMLRPEIAAIVIMEGGYTTTVKGSIDLAEGIDKNLYVFTDEELANLVWQLNFPQEVIDTYTSFWEELSTVE